MFESVIDIKKATYCGCFNNSVAKLQIRGQYDLTTSVSALARRLRLI